MDRKWTWGQPLLFSNICYSQSVQQSRFASLLAHLCSSMIRLSSSQIRHVSVCSHHISFYVDMTGSHYEWLRILRRSIYSAIHQRHRLHQLNRIHSRYDIVPSCCSAFNLTTLGSWDNKSSSRDIIASIAVNNIAQAYTQLHAAALHYSALRHYNSSICCSDGGRCLSVTSIPRSVQIFGAVTAPASQYVHLVTQSTLLQVLLPYFLLVMVLDDALQCAIFIFFAAILTWSLYFHMW